MAQAIIRKVDIAAPNYPTQAKKLGWGIRARKIAVLRFMCS